MPDDEPILLQECALIQIPRIENKSLAVDDASVTIISKISTVEKNRLARFSGGVALFNKEQKIIAEQMEFNRQNNQIKAQGNIHFQNDALDVFAESLSAGGPEQSTSMTQAAYHLGDNPGHGGAGKILINSNGTLTLVDSTFTTCQEEQPDWILQASEINISTNENFGEAYNARFRIFNVPVLYIPYFTFPVTKTRKSGFLYPQISSSDASGLEIKTPFYWNIAENIDATITPRYLSKRGTQLLSELRYLSQLQSGSINVEYLSQDHELKANSDSRYLARFQHIGTFSDRFRAHVDYTTISDDNYLIDLGSEHYNANDAYLYQIGELSYFGSNWQATMKLQDFEVLGDHIQSYKTTPQIEFSRYQPLNFWHAQFNLYSEISRFESPNIALPQTERYHLEAGLTIPLATPAWFFNSEFSVLQTNYRQENIAPGSALLENVSRTLPKIRFHGGVNFDRNINYFGEGLTQTLEPQLQYLYIPDKDQTGIGLYDTTLLQDDYNGLFRDKRYSGLDRIAEANQYSWGVTSRILDTANQELLRLSLGKIVYINNSNIAIDDVNDITADQSALAAELFVQASRQWQIRADLQYSTEENLTNKSQMSLDYQSDSKQLWQLSHRYSRNVSGNKIEQMSLLASLPLNQKWQFVGRITQDLQQSRNLESYGGFQYESCCWAVRFAYHRQINSNLDQPDFSNENRNEFDRGFMLQFEIKGFSGPQSSVDAADMFNSSIFGYKRPYFLNN